MERKGKGKVREESEDKCGEEGGRIGENRRVRGRVGIYWIGRDEGRELLQDRRL